MILHKILQGEGAGTWLPFALSRLKALEKVFGAGFFSQKFYPAPNITVEVQQAPPFQYVRIIAGGGFFEFFTNGNPVVKTVATQGGETFLGFEYASVQVALSLAGTGAGKHLVAKPTTSGRAPFTKKAPSGRLPQIQLVDEPVAYVPKGPLVYESYAPTGPFSTGALMNAFNSGNGLYGYAHFATTDSQRYNRGGWAAYNSRDLGFDVPFEYAAKGGRARDAYIVDGADWLRANAIQKVTDSTFGTRAFGIAMDAFNQISVFPLGEIGPVDGYKQNVKDEFVQQYHIPIPSWVYVNSIKTKDAVAAGFPESFRTTPELDWKFSHDGKKACAVVLKRDEAVFDSAFYGTAVGDEPYDIVGFNFYEQYDGVYSHRLSEADTLYDEFPQRYFYAPGLVEAEIKIKLTGERDQDFSVEVSLREVRNPDTNPYCTLLAGYVWQDIKAADWTAEHPTFDAHAGDFYVLDIERWYNSTTVSVNSFLSLKNLTTDKELRTFNGDIVLDYDLPTMSFALREKYDVTDIRPFTKAQVGGTEDCPVLTRHFGVSIWTQNKFKELLTPDSMDNTTRGVLRAAVSNSPRAALTPPDQWVLIPLNEARDWSDPELNKQRWQLSTDSVTQDPQWTGGHTHKNKDPAGYPGDPSADTSNWFLTAIRSYNDTRYLIYAANPHFGWYCYTDEIFNRLWLTPWSTFFVHPEGTWAFYNATLFYNRSGIMNSYQPVNCLTLFDITQFEHCVFDRVHFEQTDKAGIVYPLDTTFLGLYNEAIAPNPGKKNMYPLIKDDLRLVLSVADYKYAPAASIYILELTASKDATSHYTIPEYEEHRPPYTVSPGSRIQGGGGSLDLTTNSGWAADSFSVRGGALDFTNGQDITPDLFSLPHFSSCVML